MSLAQAITLNGDEIRKRLRPGRAHWDALVEAVDRAERHAGRECHDEQL